MRLPNYIRERLPQIRLTLLVSFGYCVLSVVLEAHHRSELADAHRQTLTDEARYGKQAIDSVNTDKEKALGNEEKAYQADLKALRNRHQREAFEVEIQIKEAITKLDSELQNSDRSRLEEQRQRWIKKRGDDLEWAIKNPDNGIGDMLAKLTRAAAPDDAEVKVSVDRFTEFSIFVQFQSRRDTNEIPAILRKTMPHSQLYVTSIRFGLKEVGQIVCDLDQVDLAQITNWGQASDSALSEMMARANRRIAILSSKTESSPDLKTKEPTSREDLSGLDKLVAVSSELFPQVQELLTSSLKTQREAVALLGLKTSRDFSERQAQLKTAALALQNARTKLSLRPEDYRSALLNDGFTKDYTDIAIRILGRQVQFATELMSAIEFHNRASSEYLETMQQNLGDWKYLHLLNPPKIEFSSILTKRAFDQANDLLVSASSRVSKAIDLYNTSNRGESR